MIHNVAVGLIMLLGVAAGLPSNMAEPYTASITLTSYVPGAAGTADISVDRYETIMISAMGLPQRTVFLVYVNFRLVGALNTGDTDAVQGSWSTGVRGKFLPLPNSIDLTSGVANITVRFEDGRIALAESLL